MATNIGTGPQDIPLNQFLGEMAFMDNQIEFGTWDPQITSLGNHTRNDAACGGFYQKIGKMVFPNLNNLSTGINFAYSYYVTQLKKDPLETRTH